MTNRRGHTAGAALCQKMTCRRGYRFVLECRVCFYVFRRRRICALSGLAKGSQSATRCSRSARGVRTSCAWPTRTCWWSRTTCCKLHRWEPPWTSIGYYDSCMTFFHIIYFIWLKKKNNIYYFFLFSIVLYCYLMPFLWVFNIYLYIVKYLLNDIGFPLSALLTWHISWQRTSYFTIKEGRG